MPLGSGLCSRSVMLIQLQEEGPRALKDRDLHDARKSCKLLLLRQLQGAMLQQQV